MVSRRVQEEGGRAGSIWRPQGRLRAFAVKVEMGASPSNVYIETLTCTVMALGSGAFGR